MDTDGAQPEDSNRSIVILIKHKAKGLILSLYALCNYSGLTNFYQ